MYFYFTIKILLMLGFGLLSYSETNITAPSGSQTKKESEQSQIHRHLSLKKQQELASACNYNISCLTKLTTKQNIMAAVTLSNLYYQGVIVARDGKKSFKLLDWVVQQKKSFVGNKDLLALYTLTLGEYHLNGVGVKPSCKNAIPLFESCADIEYPQCYYNLANVYYNGCSNKAFTHPVNPDLEKSFYYYSKLADTKSPPPEVIAIASANVAIMYVQGIGTEVNIPKGLEYFEKFKKTYKKAKGNLPSEGFYENFQKALFGTPI